MTSFDAAIKKGLELAELDMNQGSHTKARVIVIYRDNLNKIDTLAIDLNDPTIDNQERMEIMRSAGAMFGMKKQKGEVRHVEMVLLTGEGYLTSDVNRGIDDPNKKEIIMSSAIDSTGKIAIAMKQVNRIMNPNDPSQILFQLAVVDFGEATYQPSYRSSLLVAFMNSYHSFK